MTACARLKQKKRVRALCLKTKYKNTSKLDLLTSNREKTATRKSSKNPMQGGFFDNPRLW